MTSSVQLLLVVCEDYRVLKTKQALWLFLVRTGEL